ncbi:hypothetical protein WS71_18860 [Burkholderia mayonis]|uniref:Uncharacterized protein n=1 Tax=Burkholderia mayonis TaxID=1385591 RepID=A0A1B4G0G8_9BURK|nr:hypothetical protein WS71_18860 [Burkholderia mayonis]KVE48404.1 hypothetical protein WS71_18370 [Burkholderia mayonis]
MNALRGGYTRCARFQPPRSPLRRKRSARRSSNADRSSFVMQPQPRLQRVDRFAHTSQTA